MEKSKLALRMLIEGSIMAREGGLNPVEVSRSVAKSNFWGDGSRLHHSGFRQPKGFVPTHLQLFIIPFLLCEGIVLVKIPPPLFIW